VYFILVNGEEITVLPLKLASPLRFTRAEDLVPFEYQGDRGELLFCFEMEGEKGRSIDPDPASYLDPPIFSGRAGVSNGEGGEGGIPAGSYYFAQERAALNRDDVIIMAIEVQREIRWEKREPENRLYVRYLYEDGAAVTQVFRPYSLAASTI
jgi:hypothetical protein